VASADCLAADPERHGSYAHLAGLKALGCMALRDGAYLLPAGADREQALQDLADECTQEEAARG